MANKPNSLAIISHFFVYVYVFLNHRVCVCVHTYKILFIFREGRKEGERETKTSICERYIYRLLSQNWLPLAQTQLGTWCDPGTYPALESNEQPLGSQASVQGTETYQPGSLFIVTYISVKLCLLVHIILDHTFPLLTRIII